MKVGGLEVVGTQPMFDHGIMSVWSYPVFFIWGHRIQLWFMKQLTSITRCPCTLPCVWGMLSFFCVQEEPQFLAQSTQLYYIYVILRIYIYIHVYGSTGKHYAQVLIFLFFKDLGAHVARTRTQTSTVILVYRYLYAIPFFILNNSILGLGTTDQLANFQYVLVNCWPSHNSSFVNSFDSMLEKTKILNESQWHVWQPRNTF